MVVIMKISRIIKKLILLVKIFNSVKNQITKSPKENVVFLDGGFGVISTSCYSLPFIFDKKNPSFLVS